MILLILNNCEDPHILWFAYNLNFTDRLMITTILALIALCCRIGNPNPDKPEITNYSTT